MAQVEISDFKYGLNRRRPRVVGIPGSLWSAVNCHISRGGDIEAAKKFVSTYTLPANSFGLAQISGQLFVFGSLDLAASMPVGVQYMRLQNGAANMVRVVHNNTYGNKHYVIAEYDDGSIQHFYDGTRVAAWDTISAGNSTLGTLATYLAAKVSADAAVDAIAFGTSILITASVPGTSFTLSTTAVNGAGGTNDQTATASTVAANVTAVAEVRATGTLTITGGTASAGVNKITQATVNGVNLIVKAVNWIQTNSATANALVVEINNNSATHGYLASAVGAIVTVQAAVGLGTTPNGFVVTPTVAGNVTMTSANMAGGVTAVAAVAQVSKVVLAGTYAAADAKDIFTIIVNGASYVAQGQASGTGTYAFVYKTREYFPAGSLLEYSAINTANDMTTAGAAAGTGFINVANDTDGTEPLSSLAAYRSNVATFSRKTIRVYSINTDATLNTFLQTLDNSGAIAPRSVLSYGDTDVFYLDETGIRSIRARDVTNAAFVDDVGSAIDTLISDWVTSLSEDVVFKAVSVIEPIDSRFMMAIGGRIFVRSYFPSSKIEAWSYYEPGFTVTDFVRTKRKLYCRDTGTIYLYGGATGTTYPASGEQTVTVELPFVTGGTPATFKYWTAFDMACQGVWQVDMLVDPDDETKLISIGKVVNNSFDRAGIAEVGDAPMIALKLTCNGGGKVTISNAVLHYVKDEES